jgi:hypothetical protein
MTEGYKTYLLFVCVFPSFPSLENGAVEQVFATLELNSEMMQLVI